MLQQFRHLFDHLVYGGTTGPVAEQEEPPAPTNRHTPPDSWPIAIKSVVVVETSGNSVKERENEGVPSNGARITDASYAAESHEATTDVQRPPTLEELWEQEIQSARHQLQPDGALTGATRELQAGLGKFLRTCHEHGVKVGPWRIQHVVDEFTFGDHPTYGVLTIAHWACKDGQPWKVGIGLFLGRGPGKPKDLEIKLAAMGLEPSIIDHLILLRLEDDMALSGKSKALWQECERSGRHARLEAMTVDSLAVLYGFPRWLGAATEAQPEGQPMPNLASLLQERCEKLLEQLCMPVHQ
jgi:hypothetical protein